MYANYNPKVNSVAPVGNSNNRYRQQYNTNKFRYTPNEDISKNKSNVVNSSRLSNSNQNNIPAAGSFQKTNCDPIINQQQQQQSFCQPIFYPYYNYYSYMNALNYNNYPYCQQIQQVPYPAQFPQQNEIKMPKLYNDNDFYNYSNPVQENLQFEDDDSFGSIFQPISLIHPTKYTKQTLTQPGFSSNTQQQNNDSIEKHNCQKIKEFESNENSNTSNLQMQSQPQKPLEKVVNEIVDNQKVFRPKTFKEIEEEEKLSNKSQSYMPKQISNMIEIKRSTKTW